LVSRVDYSVRFEVDLETIPEGARQEIRRTMQQVADAVSTIPLSSPFWSSMKHSLLQLDVKGYRVVYRVDPAAREIRVVEVSPVQH
jgi:mRNA-degrading endonuclease RelE of RelBE toxin-antitoxin system